MVPPVRRIVTGQAPDGANVFTHVEDVEATKLRGGAAHFHIWSWRDVPTLPHYDPAPYPGVAPSPWDYDHVNVFVFPPNHGMDSKPTSDAMPAADADAVNINLSRGGGHDACGMHCTDTIDIGFVLQGQVLLDQGDGAEVLLRLGDVFIQNGAAHAWRNPTDEPCTIGLVNLKTTRAESPREEVS